MTDASKITASHRSRQCLVHVRQSTLAQTRVNTESLERQYELAGPAQRSRSSGATDHQPGAGKR
jgi:hypothetical protein